MNFTNLETEASMIFFKKHLLPGFIFQSVVIGGGYGTGRELVEFFLIEGSSWGIFRYDLSHADLERSHGDYF